MSPNSQPPHVRVAAAFEQVINQFRNLTELYDLETDPADPNDPQPAPPGAIAQCLRPLPAQ